MFAEDELPISMFSPLCSVAESIDIMVCIEIMKIIILTKLSILFK